MKLEDYTFSKEIVTLTSAVKETLYKETKDSPEFLKQLEKEITLLKSLPVNPPIFVAQDLKNKRVFSALIAGPEGTPYEGGLYPFSIYLPPNYPQVPPKVLFQSNVRHRINPSIYEGGKVSCSLLGTWGGSAYEKWLPEVSTIYQVLMSIQSILLIEEPYFLEPGYDRTYGTAHAMDTSRKYSGLISYYTLKYGILDIIQNCYLKRYLNVCILYIISLKDLFI